MLAGAVALSLAANLAQAQPDTWGRIVAAVPPAAFLVAVSMIERRAARRPRPIAAEDGGPGELSGPGRPSPLGDAGDEAQSHSAWGGQGRASLRWVLVHMIEEYARHNGHADLIRESIDGQTGE